MTDQERIRLQILKYLQAHPEAGDTLEGIAGWWLMQQRVEDSVRVVSKVLEQLKADGVIVERHTRGGKSIYLMSESSGKQG
ncbi:MAG TPA: hypothetical protein VGX48_23020 [Pyrinomonadaceae bacterium]|jgi:Fe2+ or Zn2+ uptake regulation protein|nr:hypothetical protein [Pyrinomonadaceae bacterium]